MWQSGRWRWWVACAAGACIAGGPATVLAHDTWFHVADQQPGSGLLVLHLGSGPRYPRSQESVPAARLADAGCVDEAGAERALAPRSQLPVALELRSRVGGARAAGCWLELRPMQLTLTPELVRVYVDDIHAPPAVRAAWAAQLKAGIAWNEVYRKFVRVELAMPTAPTPASMAALRRPRGYPLELVPVGAEPVRAGKPAEFQALADGKPVAGLPVEFVNLRSPLGIWKDTDARGRITLALPVGGEWLLRSTVLEPPPAAGEPWHSRFATLTVQVP
jgi:uncharacterized GH25 family protein